MSISLWILIRPETSGVVLSAGDQSWPVEGSREEGRKKGEEGEGKGGKGGRGGEGREERRGKEGDES